MTALGYMVREECVKLLFFVLAFGWALYARLLLVFVGGAYVADISNVVLVIGAC